MQEIRYIYPKCAYLKANLIKINVIYHWANVPKIGGLTLFFPLFEFENLTLSTPRKIWKKINYVRNVRKRSRKQFRKWRDRSKMSKCNWQPNPISTLIQCCSSAWAGCAASHGGIFPAGDLFRVWDHLTTCTMLSPSSHQGSTQTCVCEIAGASSGWSMQIDQAWQRGRVDLACANATSPALLLGMICCCLLPHFFPIQPPSPPSPHPAPKLLGLVGLHQTARSSFCVPAFAVALWQFCNSRRWWNMCSAGSAQD